MIYLDNAATTKPYDEVIDVVADCMKNNWGNASAEYELGLKARREVERVREQIAEDINCSPDEIIFTSGACEANSLALRKIGIIHCPLTEHKSIIELADNIDISVNSNGQICDFDNYVSNNILPYNRYAIAYASGETGTIQDIKKLRQICKGYTFHCDATQVYPYQKIDVKDLDIDTMAVSGQKFHAPKGVGFLYIKKGTYVNPLIFGEQENGLRGGTYNTPLIVGMGKALEITRKINCNEKLRIHRDYLEDNICNGSTITNILQNRWVDRLPNHLAIRCEGVLASDVVTLAESMGVIISRGSACNSGDSVPNMAYKALGYDNEATNEIIRITIDNSHTSEEIMQACKIIKQAIKMARGRR